MTDPLFTASPLAPLEHRAFRSLLLMWILSHLSTWMWSVAAAMVLLQLQAPPLWVALVQGALSLPVLLLGLPFGALADMLDRRRLLLLTQVGAGSLALLTAGLSAAGVIGGSYVLLATFAFGCCVAMRLPTYGATVPSIVPRPQLAAALGLNAVCMNVSRIAGPLLAGLLITQTGLPVAFLVIGTLCCIAFFAVRSWQAPPYQRPEHVPSITASMRAGIGYAMESRPFASVLLRIAVFCAGACGIPALLPLVAQDIEGSGPSTFTLLFAGLGAGAVLSTTFLQRLRVHFARDQLELFFGLMHGASALMLAYTRSLPVALVTMVFAGISWLGVANSTTTYGQLILPDWVRARGMAIYQMALMGSMAVGAAVWGQVANHAGARIALAGAGAWMAVGIVLTVWLRPAEKLQD